MRTIAREVRAAIPICLALTVALTGVVIAGSHLSNAFPSEEAPFGWPGPADFERGVATVRSDLVVAASLPALLMGALALRERDPSDTPARTLAAIHLAHSTMIAVAVGLAGLFGSWGAAKTPFDAWLSFTVAHTVLAVSFYSIALLLAAILRRQALALALVLWVGLVSVYDAVVRVVLFRTEGYHALASGAFPDWFWTAQAASPISSYRGILILWRPHFRDYLEKAALDGAVLPGWLTPAAFVLLALVLWILLPLGLALAAWRARGRSAALAGGRARATGAR